MRESAEIQESPGLGEIEPRRIIAEHLVYTPHLESLLQNLGEGIVFLDPSLCILYYVNPVCATLLQRPADELRGTTLSSILGDDKKDSLIRLLKTLAPHEGNHRAARLPVRGPELPSHPHACPPRTARTPATSC